ncbi:MAG TPA: class I SAM-dependent methyltransferase [Azospirillaceae bacterium]|nr:class I SAM-dependent methyltransferase [Azospirillaceae bacterium]
MTTAAAFLDHLAPGDRRFARARGYICPLDPVLEPVPPGATHLDIGCGRGLLIAAAMTARGTRSAGVEVSAAAIGRATALLGRVAGALGTAPPDLRVAATAAEWPAGPFQAVTLVDVLHHVPPPVQEEFLRAAAARVAPGGVLVFKDMAMRPAWKRMMNTLHDLASARELVNYVPLERVVAVLGAAGLDLAETRRYGVLWYAHELAVFRRRAA